MQLESSVLSIMDTPVPATSEAQDDMIAIITPSREFCYSILRMSGTEKISVIVPTRDECIPMENCVRPEQETNQRVASSKSELVVVPRKS